jgi:8-oxo-dGTP pyrophosphatase MutT (NUDIX family)
MAIKRIFSAGGIVVRDGKVLVTQHSKHKGWDFPKGHLEQGETSEQAALREVAEETGVVAQIVEKVGKTEYFYWEDGPHSAPDGATRGKQKVLKTVVFFLMKFLDQGEATTAFEVSDMVWLKPEDVEDKLTFKDTKRLWGEVVERVKGLELRG